MKDGSPNESITVAFDSARTPNFNTPYPNGDGLKKISSRYELQDRIAEGGIGAIYRAWDRVLDRIVAVKVMLADDPSTEEIRRFADEAHTLGQLSHPNIPPIYDHGVLLTTKDVGRIAAPNDATINAKTVRTMSTGLTEKN